MLQDYKLGLRMLLKYPGLTLAGGVALAIAIAVGGVWYDVSGKIMNPTIPLPAGDRLVLIETQNTLTNSPESRVVRDFLEWRRELRTIENLGAYRTDTRNLVVDNAVPEPIQVAELTAAAFRAARVPPLLGRALLDSDEAPGAPGVIVIGYDLWQRSFNGRQDVLGLVVRLGNTPATVAGVMPKGFAYPVNHAAWTALSLRASYEPLEGGAISVIGRLVPGVSREQANGELRAIGERTAAALPATHEHLRSTARRLGEASGNLGVGEYALRNLPALLVLAIACLSVGTLVYARTATREGEIAVRSALGANRARIMAQLFVEALVLAVVAAVIGLLAADRAMTWGVQNFNQASGGVPFWITPGLRLSTIAYAAGLAIVTAAMLSLLPALKATRARVQSPLANRGTDATLRFGRVWTTAMIAQVALTAIGIPVAMETASEARQKLNIRAEFPSREYLAARIDLDQPFAEATSAFNERRIQTFAALERAIAQEPGVIGVTFADRALGSVTRETFAEVHLPDSAVNVYGGQFRTLAVGPGFFDTLDRPVVAGRAFNGSDWNKTARTVIVNEAFARWFVRETGRSSPIAARIRYPLDVARDRRESPRDFDEDPARNVPQAGEAFEIVGIVRDIGLNPDDSGNEMPYVFRTATAAAVSPLVMSVRVRGTAAALAASLPAIASTVDTRLLVRDSQPLDAWIRQSDNSLATQAGALAAVTLLVLFLSALGIFSLMSVSVSRRTREIGLRTALGAHPRHVLTGILSRAVLLMGSGITVGGAVLLLSLVLGLGPSGIPSEDVPLFVGYLAVTSAVMLAACLTACIGPASRALRINPTEALRES
jgi:predicted permease